MKKQNYRSYSLRVHIALLLLTGIFCPSSGIHAQQTIEEKIDSLKQLKSSSSDLDTLSYQLDIGKLYLRVNTDTARYLLYEVYEQAVGSNLNEVAAKAISYYAVALMYQSKNDSSEYYFTKARELAKGADYDLITTIINNQTINYYYLGRYELVLANFGQLAKLAVQEVKPRDQAMARNNLGLTYLNLFDYKNAIANFLKAEKLYDSLAEKDALSAVYNNLSIASRHLNNVQEAIAYGQKALAIDEYLGDKTGLSNGYINAGINYEEINNTDSALYFYNRSILISKEINAMDNLQGAYVSVGILYRNIERLDSAERYFKLAIDLSQISNETDDEDLARAEINYGVVLIRKGNHKKAEDLIKHGLELGEKLAHLGIINSAQESLSELYESTGRYKLALYYHQQFKSSSDSILNVDNLKAIEELEIRYETEKKEKAIELLSVQNRLKDIEITFANNRFYFALLGIVLGLTIILVLFNRYKHKQRALLAEEKASSQKLGFKALIEGVEKERKRIAQELHDGLGQLLSTARLNVSAMEDKFEQVVTKQWENSIKLIDDAVIEVRHISHNMMPNALISIGFEAALSEQVHIINDAGKIKVHTEMPNEKIDLPENEAIALYRVIQEVLNNALKYAKAKNIWIKISTDHDVRVLIKDDGQGFDTNLISGSEGIGWKNIKYRMEILNGEIDIKSKPGMGSQISLKLVV